MSKSSYSPNHGMYNKRMMLSHYMGAGAFCCFCHIQHRDASYYLLYSTSTISRNSVAVPTVAQREPRPRDRIASKADTVLVVSRMNHPRTRVSLRGFAMMMRLLPQSWLRCDRNYCHQAQKNQQVEKQKSLRICAHSDPALLLPPCSS
jgi:hypothetical protein